jgi:GTP:adenosylcobinamide-phosphate guanylyltransferase
LAPAFQTSFVKYLGQGLEIVISAGLPLLYSFVLGRVRAAAIAKTNQYVENFEYEQMVKQLQCQDEVVQHRGGKAVPHDSACSLQDDPEIQQASEEQAIDASTPEDLAAAEATLEDAEVALETLEEVIEAFEGLEVFL